MKPKNKKYTIKVQKDPYDMYVAWVEELPGCYSQGKTKHLAIKNIKDAINEYKKTAQELDIKIPLLKILKKDYYTNYFSKENKKNN